MLEPLTKQDHTNPEHAVYQGDFSTILSSTMIADIVETYFNAELYKKPVKVVDLKPTADGYIFVLALVQEDVTNALLTMLHQSDTSYEPTIISHEAEGHWAASHGSVENIKGKSVSKKKEVSHG